MPRRGSLFWGIVAVLVAGTLVYGPAELARRSTGQGEPVDFLTHPQEGWRFVADALSEIGSARAGSPGEAGALAAQRSRAHHASRCGRLLYVPDLRVPVGAGSGEATAKGRLVWASVVPRPPGRAGAAVG